MRKRTLSVLFATLFIGVSAAMAGLDAPPILNHSFEAISDPGNAWGYEIDDWFQSGGDFATFWEDSSIGITPDGGLWSGAEAGGRLYQQVGTVDDSTSYEITALIGARWGTSFNTGVFSLYASTSDDATNAVDGVALSSFATLLSSINVTTNSGVSAGADIFTVTVNLPTGTGHAGEVLWLEFGSVAGKDYFDDISIAASAPATAPGPAWTTNVVSTSDGIAGYAYSDSLGSLAVDPHGDAITYAVTAGNPWLSVSEGGALSGTPDVLGTNTFTVTATDGTEAPVSATLTIFVADGTSPEWNEPVTASDAIIDEIYADTIAGSATDPDGGTIIYTLQDSGTWLSVAPDGALSGTPVAGDAGTNTFTVTADDGVDPTTNATLTIVVRTTLPPVWDEPVTGSDGYIDTPYADTLAGKATDPDGETITYSLQDVGTWLSVETNGVLSGTPTAGDAGTNTFTVIADDGVDATSTATLTIYVTEAVVIGPNISINFPENNNQAFSGGENIGPLGTDSSFWNNAIIDWGTGTFNSGTMGNLMNDSGVDTGATITWDSKNTWYNGDGTGSDQAKLSVGYLDDGDGDNADGYGVTMTVSDIPYAQYRVYALIASDQGGTLEAQNAEVNGVWVDGDGSSNLGEAHKSVADNTAAHGEAWTELVPGSVVGNYWKVESSGSTLQINVLARYAGGQGAASRGSITGLIIEGVELPDGDAVTVAITGPTAGSEMVLTWTGQAGYGYTVQTNSNLIIANWGDLETGIPGVDGTVTYTNGVSTTEGEIFYQVITE